MKKILTMTGAGVTALALGAGIVGSATAASASPQGKPGQHQDRRSDRVTGPEAQKAIDAALAAVPGTADHAHKTADGYRVAVTTADGKRIVVTLDADFVVTGQQEAPAKGRPGKVAITADEKAKASDAALAAVPGATVLDVFKTKSGSFGVLVRTSDGVKKFVKLDGTYAVTRVTDAKRGKGRGHHRHHGQEVTGEAFTKAEAAALAAVPGGTVLHVHQKGNTYHVLVEKADGTKAHLTLDADFVVTATKSFTLKRAS